MPLTCRILSTWKNYAKGFVGDDHVGAAINFFFAWPFLLVILFYVVIPCHLVALLIDLSCLFGSAVMRACRIAIPNTKKTSTAHA